MARKNSPRHEQILEAAAVVFAHKGYYGSRVTDIAARAGVADGTIYIYFRSKEKILEALFQEAMRRFLNRAQAELEPLEGPEARLRHIARLHLESLGAHRDLAIVFQVELRQSVKFLERVSTTILAGYFDLIRGVIRQGQAEGLWRRDIPEKVITKCFFGMLDDMATNWVLSRRNYRLAEMVPLVADLFVRGLGARP